MKALSKGQHEKARKIESSLRKSVEYKGREYVGSVLDVSDATVSKFVSGAHGDTKINLQSLSDLLAGLGFRLCPSDSVPVRFRTVELMVEMVREAYGSGSKIREWEDWLVDEKAHMAGLMDEATDRHRDL